MDLSNLIPKKGGILEPEEAAKLVELVVPEHKPDDVIELKKHRILFSQYEALEAIAGHINRKPEDFSYLEYEPNKSVYYNTALVCSLDDSGYVTHLGLSFSKFDAIPSEVSTLTELKELRMSNNKITKIENLDKLVKLNILDLHGNQIAKIENLDFPEMETIDLHNNHITRIENLEKLPKLQYIYLHANIIDKTRADSYLKSIKKSKVGLTLDNQ